ncbi:Elongator complex protein 5 [Neohortaea acidophila]|uniref:Elongator complex protein 5 n=1 Tax=Neohortaea acidophila TaxID=245834 RepID=A0A6A6PFS3_9PEZI|nr:Elongator complex protein 5 [Neohortaea acidophila]KAF2478829.1 Elongator complex protein 5 [Neohortaea acidophila]
MAPTSLQHRRTHNILLISKLLNQRDASSPFTLILDSLEQSGRPLLAEFLSRAKAAKVQTIFVSLETLRPSRHVDVFIRAWGKTPAEWRKEVVDALKAEPTQRKLLIIDCLNSLAAIEAASLPALLSSFITPSTSLLAVYHQDVPTLASNTHDDAYSPSTITLLKYLATTIFTAHSLHHVLARKAARDRSHAEPVFGLQEGVEGGIQSLGANGVDGVVLEMEHRRKSGRGVREWYCMTPTSGDPSEHSRATLSLLEDHSSYLPVDNTAAADSDSRTESTFELGLTEKQRRDREGVVLPYFDAQKGGGDGGRILYDMGSEDDFDEEEDEI